MIRHKKVNRLLKDYLESMPATIADINLMQTLTLKQIRPGDISKVKLAKELGLKTPKAIGKWEQGLWLDGITTTHVLIMAKLFHRRIEEVVAAVENTRMLTEQEDIDENTPPLEVVQR